ncbi:hypothetical protein BDR04DRAFT_1086052 [Suillus decipiens]|nr:hypothetical protein BDR04DRAFT_1086052 [Suillus decipiens]
MKHSQPSYQDKLRRFGNSGDGAEISACATRSPIISRSLVEILKEWIRCAYRLISLHSPFKRGLWSVNVPHVFFFTDAFWEACNEA